MSHFQKGDKVKILRGGDSILARDMAGCEGIVEEEYLTTCNIRFPLKNLPERAKLFCGDMAGPYNFSKMDLERL